MTQREKGAATVEIVAAIPLVVFLMMLLVEVGMVMFDQLAVAQAAREGARAAAVSPDTGAVVMAATQATGLDSSRMKVDVGPRPAVGGLVEVKVAYQGQLRVPFTGTLLWSPTLNAQAAMAVES